MQKQAKPSTKPSPLPTVATATQAASTQAAPQTTTSSHTVVAVRGAGAVAYVQVAPGCKYTGGVGHTQQRWALLNAAQHAGAIALAPLMATLRAGSAAGNYSGPGVPGHYVAYALRKGWLLAVQPPANPAPVVAAATAAAQAQLVALGLA
jgi:hypothetical protein